MASRVASSKYDDFVERIYSTYTLKKQAPGPSLNLVKLNNNLYNAANNNHRTKSQWLKISKTAAFFQGKDKILGPLIIMVFEDPESTKIGTVLFSMLGDCCYNAFTMDHRSRFFTACKNLAPEHKNSNVRRALAITLLKTYSSIDPIVLKTALSNLESNNGWDETVAGEVASSMKLITDKTPESLGELLLNSGFLQPHYINSALLDVIYEDKPEVTEGNNNLVFQLGDQLNQLFDPLTEYSPESADIVYVPPTVNGSTDDQLVNSICNELIQLQENVTTRLVDFLRDVVIPTRIKSLNDSEFASISKVNQAFPPTIDEITRVNCIFLEALKEAEPFGSFEIIKACGSTIPYFYKANMRHESAIKSSARPLKEFLKEYQNNFPDYTETQIESIIKSSINLTKTKLILQRLVNTKNWETSELPKIEHFFKIACDTINSFGNDDLQPYNRLLTPSGKIMTEVCDDWPSVLSYGWMNRKVISVLDTRDKFNGDQGVIILFTDYIVFASIESDISQKDYLGGFQPQVSSILMNSLINENPINNLPRLKTKAYSSLLNLEVTSFDQKSIRIIIKGEKVHVLTLELDDSLYFLDLLNKARILSKTSPFHLFKNEALGLKIYSAAHERESYFKEITRSSIGFFLNLELSIETLKDHGMFGGISAKLTDNNMVETIGLMVNGEQFNHKIPISELSGYIVEEVSSLEKKRYSRANPELFRALTSANQAIIRNILGSASTNGNPISSSRRKTSAGTVVGSLIDTKGKSVVACNDNSSVKIASNHRDNKKKTKNILSKLSKVFSRRKIEQPSQNKSLSDLISLKIRSRSSTKTSSFDNVSFFGRKHSENIRRSDEDVPKLVQPKISLIQTANIGKVPSQSVVKVSQTSSESTPETELFDINAAETSSFDDCKTFESLMVPIFSDDLELESNTKLIENSSGKWPMNRDQSSVQSDLNSEVSELIADKSPLISLTEKKENDDMRDSPSIQAGSVVPGSSQSTANDLKQDLPKLNSIDDDFRSPLLKVTVSFPDDSYREDETYDNPNGLSAENFGDSPQLAGYYEDREDELNNCHSESVSFNQYDTPTIHGEMAFTNYETSGKLPTLRQINFGNEGYEDTRSLRTESFKSCLTNPDWGLDEVDNIEDTEKIAYDDSFRYLASYMNGEPDVKREEIKESESFKTLPRSFSSIKYLAAYIDNDTWTSELDMISEFE